MNSLEKVAWHRFIDTVKNFLAIKKTDDKLILVKEMWNSLWTKVSVL